MKLEYIHQHLNEIAEKQIKNIKGFYTHFIASFIILPFIILINLKTVPQFQWFWYAIIAWFIGLLIHWINVFAFANMSNKIPLENKNLNKKNRNNFLEETHLINDDYQEEKRYLKAKKQTQTIKNFYLHLVVSVFVFPVILFVNLEFVSNFDFFDIALGGLFISIFFHWLEVFGFTFLGFGKGWEQRKTEEIIKKYI